MKNEEINLATLAIHFADADKARELLERLRWKEGVLCPHCNAIGAYRITAKKESKAGARKGLWKCVECREQFTVTVGTIFEDSKIPLNKWLLAIHLICSSKKGMSAHQLHRSLGITYKSAWFMAHRIRYAMTQEPLFSKLNGTVEVDETYIGGKAKNMHKADRERRIQGRGKPIELDTTFRDKLNKIIGQDEIIAGSASGKLEWLNLHDRNLFNIYPVIGAKKITCRFPTSLRSDVIEAIDKDVVVYGFLKYRQRDKFPYFMDVKEIELVPVCEESPTLWSLKGIAPDATGDMTANDFVRLLRDENP